LPEFPYREAFVKVALQKIDQAIRLKYDQELAGEYPYFHSTKIVVIVIGRFEH